MPSFSRIDDESTHDGKIVQMQCWNHDGFTKASTERWSCKWLMNRERFWSFRTSRPPQLSLHSYLKEAFKMRYCFHQTVEDVTQLIKTLIMKESVDRFSGPLHRHVLDNWHVHCIDMSLTLTCPWHWHVLDIDMSLTLTCPWHWHVLDIDMSLTFSLEIFHCIIV